MTKSDFTTTLLVDQTPEEAFEAINDVRGWWTGEPGIEGSTGKLGDEFIYRYEPYHYSKQKITELIPGKKVVWNVTDSNLSFVKDKNEWTGTKIIFDISKKAGKTEIRFTHMGLVPGIECYDGCSNAWGQYIHESLFKLLTKEKGTAELV
ncbi:MAG TPA: SRPBCC domain-containing protein [Chitinophagaceae bacterium]|nr:SRPBCC domain-containing protein [Chitinophagaceae bacterium]